MIARKDAIMVKFQAIDSSNTVGLFYVRLLIPLSTADVTVTQNDDCKWKVRVWNNDISVSGLQKPATVLVYDTSGHLLNHVRINSNKVKISGKGKGFRIVKVVSGEIVQVNEIIVE